MFRFLNLIAKIYRFYSSPDEIYQWHLGTFKSKSEQLKSTFATFMQKEPAVSPNDSFLYVGETFMSVGRGSAVLKAFIDCQEGDGVLIFRLVN